MSIEYTLGAVHVEKRDRPQHRGTLYMHEFKDASKYF